MCLHRFPVSLPMCCMYIFHQSSYVLQVDYHFSWSLYVVCYAEKMCHLLSAACQYTSYFVWWTTNTLGFFYLVLHTVKMCHCLSVFYQYASYLSYELPFLLVSFVVCYAEKMCHLLLAACQYASYFVRYTTNSLDFFYVVCCVDSMCHLVVATYQFA